MKFKIKVFAALIFAILLLCGCGEKVTNGIDFDSDEVFAETDIQPIIIDQVTEEIPELVLPSEDDFSDPDFIIEKGVLTRYLGSDLTVQIPDTVGKIEEKAFISSPKAAEIEEIILGHEVGIIDPKAFFGLDSLKIVSAGENEHFLNHRYEYDGNGSYEEDSVDYLGEKNGSIIFCFGGDKYLHAGEDSIGMFTADLKLGDSFTYVADNAVLKISLKDMYPDREDPSDIDYFIDSVEYRDVTKKFDGFNLNGNFSTQAFEAEGVFVLLTHLGYNYSYGYIFTQNQVLDFHEKQLDVSYSLFKDGDGRLCYRRIYEPLFSPQYNATAENITSRDQPYLEEGKFNILQNNTFALTPERSLSISEYIESKSGKSFDEWFNGDVDAAIEANIKRKRAEIAPGIPEEDDDSDPNFVIENGVLKKYLGGDAVVRIPDSVGEIGANAFADNERITEIVLGKNVMIIDDRAFFSIPNLDKVSVGENTYFTAAEVEFESGSCLYSKLYQQIFYFKNGLYVNDLFGDESLMQDYNRGQTTHFICENTVFTLGFEEDEGHRYWDVYSLEYENHILRFGGGAAFYGNFVVMLFEAEEHLIFATLYNWFGDTWIFGDEGVYECHNGNIYLGGDGYEYNDILPSGIRYYNEPLTRYLIGEDGSLIYERTVRKYSGSQVVSGDMFECVGRDEICREYGAVSFDGATPIHTPSEKVAFEDFFDVDKLFAYWSENFRDDWHIEELRNVTTFDEYCETNAKYYERSPLG